MPRRCRTGVTLDWTRTSPARSAPSSANRSPTHLAAALANGAPAAIAPMDKNLVANVRDMLIAYPLEYRIFSRLRRANVGADFPEFSVASAGGPNAVNVFERASGKPLTRGIPGLFTPPRRLLQGLQGQGAGRRQAVGRRGALGAGREDAHQCAGQGQFGRRGPGHPRAPPLPAGVHQGLGRLHRRRAADQARQPGPQPGRRPPCWPPPDSPR